MHICGPSSARLVYEHTQGAPASSIFLQRFDVPFLRKSPNIKIARAVGYRTIVPRSWQFLCEALSDGSFPDALEGLWDKVLGGTPLLAQNMEAGQWTGNMWQVPFLKTQTLA